jgi:hypothetical protein
MQDNFVPLDTVRETLERSGYVMESRLVRSLTDNDFFVEPNVSHRDNHTGKSRELDLTAESSANTGNSGVCVKTTFVIEAINNRFPIVLLTERPWTPNTNTDSYIKLGTTPDPCPFMDKILPYVELSRNDHNLFSQYCALTKKNGKDEFMASHPDDMYTSVLKLAEFTEIKLKEFNSWSADDSGKFWRAFRWHPMLVVSGQLLTAKVSPTGKLLLQETPIARLEFNWHDAEGHMTTVIEVVREDFLIEQVNNLRRQDLELEDQIHAQYLLEKL